MSGIDNNVVLLIQSEQVDGSRLFIDTGVTSGCPHSLAYTGNTKHSVSQFKYGMSSIYFDGVSTLYTTGNIPVFGTADFTIDFWYRPEAKISAYPCIIQSEINSEWYSGEWVICDRHDLYPEKFMVAADSMNSTNAILVSSTSVVDGVWYHIALVRSGTSLKLYINGIAEATYTSSVSFDNGIARPIYLGGQPNGKLKGYVEEVRISQGIARWTSNFTPSLLPYSLIRIDPLAGLKLEPDPNYILGAMNDAPTIIDRVQYTGATGSYWYANYSYGVDLGIKRAINKLVCMTTCNTTATSWYDTSYDSVAVYKSDDGTNWTLVQQFDAPAFSHVASGQLAFVLVFPSAELARYFKVVNVDVGSTLGVAPGGASLSICEIGVWTNSLNVALGKPTSAQNYQGGYPSSELTDGNAGGAGWGSGMSAPTWCQIDLQEVYSISKVRIRYANSATYGATVLGSLNGTDFFTLGTIANGNYDWAIVDVDSINVRYVRVNTTYSTNWSSWVNIYEIEIYPSDPAVDVTINGTGTVVPSDSSVPINYNEHQTFAFTPGIDNVLDSVLVDGTSVGAVTEYTFNDVISNHNLSINFLGTCVNHQLVLLIHSDDTDGSTTFFDSGQGINSPHSISMFSNVHHETDQHKFGDTSISFGDYASGAGLSISNSSDFDFGTSDFTIDFWVYFNSHDTYESALSTWSTGNLSGWFIGYREMGFYRSQGNILVSAVPLGQLMPLSQWMHLAYVRSGNSLKCFKDGLLTSESDVTGISFNSSGNALTIGRMYNDFAAYNIPGYLDEIRILKGTAKWTSNFTPPAYPYSLIEVNASASNGGSILPTGLSCIEAGNDQTFSITPDRNYTLTDVLVDSISVGAVTSYTLTTILDEHTIQASFNESALTWNPVDKHTSIELSNNDLTATTIADLAWRSVRAGICRNSGKWYWEARLSTATNRAMIGVATNTAPLDDYIGADTSGWSYSSSGVGGLKCYDGISTAYGESFNSNDLIGIALDLDAGKIWFSKNGVWQGSGDPASGTGECFSEIAGYVFPSCTLYGIGTQWSVNFGAAQFTYAPPTGFSEYAPYANQYTISVQAGTNGHVLPSGMISINIGATQNFSIVPATGYAIADVLVDGVSVGVTSNYEFTAITENHIIEATFQIAQGKLSPTHGLKLESDTPPYTFRVMLEEPGIIDAILYAAATGKFWRKDDSYGVDLGVPQEVEGFIIRVRAVTIISGTWYNSSSDSVSVYKSDDGTNWSFVQSFDSPVLVSEGSPNWYFELLLSPFQTARFFKVVCVDNALLLTASGTDVCVSEIEVYAKLYKNIISNCGIHGTITPLGSILVEVFDNQEYTIIPDSNYHIDDVLIDGVSVGAVSTYTFENVVTEHLIDASFAIDTFEIYASTGSNGTISPLGSSIVNATSSQMYSITPIPGYHIVDVLVDGVSVGIVSTYTFSNILDNHTISATFSINLSDQYVKFLGHFDIVLRDDSGNDKPVTGFGASVISNTQAKFGSGSVYLPGAATDYVNIDMGTDSNFGSGDFTIDFWAYYISGVNSGSYICKDGVMPYCPWMIGYNSNLLYMSSNGASWDIANSKSFGAVTANMWYHFAVVRNGTNFYMFKNGIQQATWTSALSFPVNNNPVVLGRYNSLCIKAYVDEVRITKGLARWISDFTPPSNAYGPEYIANDTYSVLLIESGNIDHANDFTDVGGALTCPHTIIANGNVHYSNVQKYFKATSIYFDGSTDQLNIPASADWILGVTWTIDMWVYATTFNTYSTLYSWAPSGWFQVFVNSSGQIKIATNTENEQTWTGRSISLNQWTHVAIVSTNKSTTVYLNGIPAGTKTVTVPSSGVADLNIGWDGITGREYNGYMDEYRVSKGIARWSGAFVPPLTTYIQAGATNDLKDAIFSLKTLYQDRIDVKTSLLASGIARSDMPLSLTVSNAAQPDLSSILATTRKAYYVRSTTGSDANNGTSWTLAKATINAALAIAGPGETIFVSQSHNYIAPTTLTYASSRSSTAPISIICVNDGAFPPTQVASTANETLSATNADILFGNGTTVYWYGINFKAGRSMVFPYNATTIYDSCSFTLNSTTSADVWSVNYSVSNSCNILQFINTRFTTNARSQHFDFYNGYSVAGYTNWTQPSRISFKGCNITGVPASEFFTWRSPTLYTNFLLDGCDLSLLDATSFLFSITGNMAVGSRIHVKNCKLHPLANIVSGSIWNTGAPDIFVENCDAGNINTRNETYRYQGTCKATTSIVRAGGASNGSTGFSWELCTNSNNNFLTPLESPPIVIWYGGVVSQQKKLTISFLHDNIGSMSSGDIWIELEYPNNILSPTSAFVSTKPSSYPLYRDTLLYDTDSSSTWSGTGNFYNVKRQKIELLFVPQMQGVLFVRIYVARPMYTVYVDPLVRIS